MGKTNSEAARANALVVLAEATKEQSIEIVFNTKNTFSSFDLKIWLLYQVRSMTLTAS
jgi:hypothetical protein